MTRTGLDRDAAREVLRRWDTNGCYPRDEVLDALEECVRPCSPTSLDRDELVRILTNTGLGEAGIAYTVNRVHAALRPCPPPTVDRDALIALMRVWFPLMPASVRGLRADEVLALPPAAPLTVNRDVLNRTVRDWLQHVTGTEPSVTDVEDMAEDFLALLRPAPRAVAGEVTLTAEEVEIVLAWSVGAGDVWGEEAWSEADQALARRLAAGER